MMTKMIAPIALALVLGALPAGAEYRRHEREKGKVEKLAHRLESAAAGLYRDAAARPHHRSWRERWVLHARHRSRRERQALHALQHFAQRADRFLEQVVRHGIHHPRAERAYRKLERAFVTAEARRSDLRRARQIRDEFEHVEHLMHRLDQRLADRSDRERRRRHATFLPDDRHTRVAFRFSY